jgi:hypothetical protein
VLKKTKRKKERSYQAMKKHEGNLESPSNRKDKQKRFPLCDSNSLTFWKRQDVGAVKRSVAGSL